MKIITFAKAVLGNIGQKEINPKIYEERLWFCAQCENYDAANDMCRICGCTCQGNKSFFNKIEMPKESCPINKWGPV